IRKELVNQLMRSSGNRKNRRSVPTFALSGNVKFTPLAIREVSFTPSAPLCSSGSAYRFEWQRSCVQTHPPCGNPSVRLPSAGLRQVRATRDTFQRADPAHFGSHKRIEKTRGPVEPGKQLVPDLVVNWKRDLRAVWPNLS